MFALCFIGYTASTLMADFTGAHNADRSMLCSIFIPIAGTIGILSVGQLIRWCKSSSRRALLSLFSIASLSAPAVRILSPGVVDSTLLLSLMMACVCGANVVITVCLPTGFVRHGISAQISGMLNFMVYLGAGLGGSLSGLVSDRWGWGSMYLLWAALSLLACCVITMWRLFLGNR